MNRPDLNRPDLMALLGRRVTVTNAAHIPAGTLTGKLVAVTDQPTLILDLDDGSRMSLLQYRCKVVPAEPAPAPPADEPDPALAEVERLAVELYKAQDALAWIRECCDIAARYSTPVTTALVREWLEGPRCGRQLAADREPGRA